MGFFEALRERAIGKDFGFFDYSPLGGIRATIEALKEMMVGEPLERVIESDGKNHTWIMNEDRGVTLHFWGVHGTDGEEVVVMVFKKP